MDLVAERVRETRDALGAEGPQRAGRPAHLGIAHLGGATLERRGETTCLKKLTPRSALQVENQARI